MNSFPSHLVPPDITCPQNQDFVVRQGQTSVQFPGAAATDDSGVPLTVTYITNTGVQIFGGGSTTVVANNLQAGMTVVTATARDNNNNMVSCTFDLNINSKTYLWLFEFYNRDCRLDCNLKRDINKDQIFQYKSPTGTFGLTKF